MIVYNEHVILCEICNCCLYIYKAIIQTPNKVDLLQDISELCTLQWKQVVHREEEAPDC